MNLGGLLRVEGSDLVEWLVRQVLCELRLSVTKERGEIFTFKFGRLGIQPESNRELKKDEVNSRWAL